MAGLVAAGSTAEGNDVGVNVGDDIDDNVGDEVGDDYGGVIAWTTAVSMVDDGRVNDGG